MQKEKDREKKQKKQTIRDWTNSRDSELKKKKKNGSNLGFSVATLGKNPIRGNNQ